MSLLVTSCTMGRQPDRLLNKGPQYLRTRTNSGLFAQDRKKSAVELLAASKAQFYSVKSSVNLDKQQDLAVSAGQNERYIQNIERKKEPSRSKSEFDLSLIQLVTGEESDENNNDINDDFIKFPEDDVINDSHSLNLHNNSPVKRISESEEASQASLTSSSSVHKEDTLNHNLTIITCGDSTRTQISKPQPKLKTFHFATPTTPANEEIPVSNESKAPPLNDEVDAAAVRKPVPLPRKLKAKPPVPLPRILSHKVSPVVTKEESNPCLPETISVPNLSHNPLRFGNIPAHETKQALISDTEKNRTLVATQTESTTSFTAKTILPQTDKSLQLPAEVGRSQYNIGSQNSYTSNATLVLISNKQSHSQELQFEKASTAADDKSICLTPAADFKEASCVNGDDKEPIKAQKKSPDVLASARPVKRERRSVSSCISSPVPGSISVPPASVLVTEDKKSSLLTTKLEMSIESVDQAVYESEISALPSASMEASNIEVPEQEAREITRSNSSLSGKNEQKSTSPLSASPTPYCSTVPRSYSDISCHLEGQHSRDSSIVSNHSRLSRASMGTDLENFFNQMGLEKGVLEPITRLKDLQTNEVFDSMSSLDSHDAASICSTYSRSEQEWSDSQSTDRSQQQTSIIERNARIIKWLCNVRKAKSQPQNSEYAAASNA